MKIAGGGDALRQAQGRLDWWRLYAGLSAAKSRLEVVVP